MMIYINAMAEQKKEIERSLSPKTDMIIEHMLYLCLAPNCTTVSHWMDEIYSFISKIDKLKGKNRFPSARMIYEWTYGKKQDLVKDTRWLSVMIEDAKDKENIADDFDVQDVMNYLDAMCRFYFQWLSEELASVGAVSRKSVREKLKALMR